MNAPNWSSPRSSKPSIQDPRISIHIIVEEPIQSRSSKTSSEPSIHMENRDRVSRTFAKSSRSLTFPPKNGAHFIPKSKLNLISEIIKIERKIFPAKSADSSVIKIERTFEHCTSRRVSRHKFKICVKADIIYLDSKWSKKVFKSFKLSFQVEKESMCKSFKVI